VLKKLIEIYKYNSVRAASFELAALLAKIIPKDYVLVPLPTIGRHIRERGFDHISLLCKKTGYPLEHVLERRNDSVQVGANNAERREQAKTAYCARIAKSASTYLLVDDVWTTGSSMMAACREMQKAGAKNLAIAVIARSVSSD
jgi:competence protein ComFC